jgi:hypothetical protein
MIPTAASDFRKHEIAWYMQNGKYPKRIVNDSMGMEYVIGDCSWNRGNRPTEFIEHDMSMAHPMIFAMPNATVRRPPETDAKKNKEL